MHVGIDMLDLLIRAVIKNLAARGVELAQRDLDEGLERRIWWPFKSRQRKIKEIQTKIAALQKQLDKLNSSSPSSGGAAGDGGEAGM
jgi:hypothetical protein